MAAVPITDTERDRVRELHGQGLGRNEIAAQLGRSAATVTKIAKALGLTFDRRATQAATAAKVADARARRAQLMHELLDDAQKLRAQLWQPAMVWSFGGKDNTFAQRQVERPSFADQRQIMTAVSTAISTSLRLDQHDGDGSVEQVGSLLGSLFDSLRAKHGDPDAGDGDAQ